MNNRNGFEKVITAIARDTVKQRRLQRIEKLNNARESSLEIEASKLNSAFMRISSAYDRDSERAAKSYYFDLRDQQVARANLEIAENINELASLLENSLIVDDDELFDSLRTLDNPPVFSPSKEITVAKPEPDENYFLSMVPPIFWFMKLFKAAKLRHAQDIELAKRKYEKALSLHQEAERDRKLKLKSERDAHDQRVNAFLEKRALRESEVDDFRKSYHEVDMDAIIAYFGMVLESSEYPPEFPQEFSVAYMPSSEQIVIDYELPSIDIVPKVATFRHVKVRNEIIEKPRKNSEIKNIYADVVASIALRTINEIFDADYSSAVNVCCFNGYVRTIDPATGKDIKPYLVSVRVTKEVFEAIDLDRVDRAICLKNLGAHVSRAASEAQPVKPIIEFDMADARFVDQTGLSSRIGSAKNLMDLNPYEFEELVANLFGKMGLESKLTRSSRDGGVDCVAYDRRPVLGGKVVIQAKRYRHTVGVSAVRDLYGTMMNEGANKGILVTTSGFGPDAYEFQKDKPIELIEGGGLLFLLKEIGVNARIVMPQE